jgi:hypothetical protein
MRAIVIEPDAEIELETAALRYEASVPGLGGSFLDAMHGRMRDVLEAPLGFPLFGEADDVRCAHAVGRFPHMVIFLVSDDLVHVLAFMHPRRRPGYWARRVP